MNGLPRNVTRGHKSGTVQRNLYCILCNQCAGKLEPNILEQSKGFPLMQSHSSLSASWQGKGKGIYQPAYLHTMNRVYE